MVREGSAVITTLNAWLAVCTPMVGTWLETWTVKLKVPAAVGVPPSPPAAHAATPRGRRGSAEHASGGERESRRRRTGRHRPRISGSTGASSGCERLGVSNTHTPRIGGRGGDRENRIDHYRVRLRCGEWR